MRQEGRLKPFQTASRYMGNLSINTKPIKYQPNPGESAISAIRTKAASTGQQIRPSVRLCPYDAGHIKMAVVRRIVKTVLP